MKNENQGFELKKSKITPMQFDMAVNTHLEGTNMLEAFNKIKLETDEAGNISEHVVENIKTMLRTAIKMTPDEIAKSKFEKMLTFIGQY